MNILLLIFLLVGPVVAQAQTTKSRTLAGDGTPITDTVSGRLDVSVQDGLALESGGNLATTASGITSLITALTGNAVGVAPAKLSLQANFESTSGWTSSAAVANLATTTTHRGVGNNFLTFDKQAGATQALISKTLTSTDVSSYGVGGHGFMWLFIPNLANVVSVDIRFGTNSTNYHEWTFPVANLTAGWNLIDAAIHTPSSQTGAGYDLSAITYMAVGVTFSASGDTLTGIIAGDAILRRVLEVESGTVETVTTTGNINLQKINGQAASLFIQSALGDNTSNSSNVLNAAAFGLVFDGSTWDRMRGDSTNGVLVNLGANNDVTVTGTVTANAGTNLNTSSLLTTTAHDAAFGTAGTADSQVRSIQGIASGVPVGVQSNGQNLATAALQDGIIKDGTGDTTQANVSSGSLHVACQSGCSGGTQYAEDTVHSSGDTLTLAGVVRQDATAALAADGDRTLLQVDSNGHLKVSNSNPNLAADNSTNSTAKVPVLGALAGSSAPTWTNGNQVPLSVDTSGALRVTGGTSATQYTEDAASAGGESLSLAGAIRQDSPTGSTSADGDYANLKTDSVGRLWTNGSGVTQPISAASLPLPSGAATAANQDGIIRDGTGDTTQANVSSGRLHVDGSGVTQPVSGSVTVTQGTGTNLHIVCDSGCSSSAGFADNSAFTFGTTAINPIGGVLDDTATNAATENSAAVARITAQKALHMNLRNNSGTEIGTAGAPLRVDPTGSTTQPVSASSLPLPTGASTAAKQPALGTAGTASSDVLTVQGIASMTPLLVNGSGVTQPVSGTVSITANSAVNVAQMNGVATTMGNGVSGTGVQRVTIASDSTGTVAATQATAANLNVRPDTSGATGAAPPARANYIGALGSGATGGLVVPVTACDSFANVNVSSATTTLLITGVSGRHVRICSYEITTSAANNIALISGTGATCGTGTTGMTGGTTSGTGHNMAANSGWTRGSGLGEINRTNATGDSVCVITSATAQLSGRIAYAIY